MTAAATHDQTQTTDHAALFAQLDEDAYWQTWKLEQTWAEGGGTILPAGTTANLFPERHAAAVAYVRRAAAAMQLADSLDVCAALMRGERVPAHRLNSRLLTQHKARTR